MKKVKFISIIIIIVFGLSCQDKFVEKMKLGDDYLVNSEYQLAEKEYREALELKPKSSISLENK